MSYKLIITEKPSAARKISDALGEKGVKNIKSGNVSYQEIERDGKKIVIVPAVGHLFGLAQKSKSWTYPVFDTEWQPTFRISKEAAYAKKYYSMIKKLSKGTKEFIVATDLDVEGETIAFTILKHICNTTDAKRMEFSTLTKTDLVNAYEHAKPHINFGLAKAGVTRHTLDFYFGINISRALTLAVKSAGAYKVLSTGRVQGPALAFLAKREKEIQAFNPIPFWQIEIKTDKLNAMYENDKILDKAVAEKVVKETTGKDAAVIEKTSKKYSQKPPTPFNLTDLQV
ncbi:MAG: DNA topoisomerase, partial [archaeon]|nr:DNA topoisomerase [archaeon]